MWFMEDTDKILGEKLEKRKNGHFTEKNWEAESTDQRHKSGRLKHEPTEENVTAVDELVSLLCQEDQT